MAKFAKKKRKGPKGTNTKGKKKPSPPTQAVELKLKNKTVVGHIKRHPDGFGFLVPEDNRIPDIYVTRKSMPEAMTGDLVEVLVRPDRISGRWRGTLTQIIERRTHKATGHFVKVNPHQGVLLDNGFAWGENVKISLSPSDTVENKDWVVVNITSYPDSPRGLCGDIISILKNVDSSESDYKRVLYSFNIPFEFSKACIKEAELFDADVKKADFPQRLDLTSTPFITIDGKTAKDFDDAIWVNKTSKGFDLNVAIADVSHYVHPKSHIDKEAFERGNSTYFPGFVAPMLPENLSNELCSLKPNVNRLAFVAQMKISSDGQLQSFDFCEALIESKARVTYGEAQQILEGNSIKEFQHVENIILTASELSKSLMKRRFNHGSLRLDLPETEIELDETGMPIDIIRTERLFAHQLIEELMLVTNVAVALFISGHKAPGLYRVHGAPKTEAIELLENFLSSLGHSENLSGSNLQKKISKAVEAFSDTPQQAIINILTLRSMKAAEYKSENIGHFGLGFDHYCHFTSPIRRYPDLLIHRTVKALLNKNDQYALPSESELHSAGTLLSACEQRSVKAERQLNAIKKARFMSQHVGSEFEGLVSSVTKFGIFVILREFDVDGLVKIEDLKGDRFVFDPQNLKLTGRRSGKVYEIGQPVNIQVVSTSIDDGKIDFTLAEDISTYD